MRPLATALTALVGATALGVLGIQVAQAGSEPAYVERDDASELSLPDDDPTRDDTRDDLTDGSDTRDDTN